MTRPARIIKAIGAVRAIHALLEDFDLDDVLKALKDIESNLVQEFPEGE